MDKTFEQNGNTLFSKVMGLCIKCILETHIGGNSVRIFPQNIVHGVLAEWSPVGHIMQSCVQDMPPADAELC